MKNLKQLFNDEISNLNLKLNEVNLFNILNETLNKYCLNTMQKIIHQHYVNANIAQKCSLKRELADMLCVIKHKNYFRYTFIQFKSQINNKNYINDKIFSIDCGQHYILVHKPQIIINGVPSNILRNSKYDTITTYAVFYTDYNNDKDCDLSSAVSVECLKNQNRCSLNISGLFKRKVNAKHKLSSLSNFTNCPIKFNNKNTYIDYDYLDCLDSIEQYNKFGEVVEFNYIDSNKMQDLIDICNTFGGNNKEQINEFFKNIPYVEREEKYNGNIEKESNNINYIVKNLLLIDLNQ